MVESYPLHWPTGRKRTSWRERSRFKTTMDKATRFLTAELQRMGVSHTVISTNVELRQDGLPYASRRAPADPGVAVYFTRKGRQQCFACDRWDNVGDNIYAVGLTIEALRGLDRWGTGDVVDAAFTGFEALPESTGKKWYEVLEVSPRATVDEIEASYRRLSLKYHPDKGGTHEQMVELNHARAQARGTEGRG